MEVGGPPQLLALLDALDPDPERRSMRAVFARRDVGPIAAWAAKLDGRKLPPEFAQFVGGHELTPQEHALRILTVAQATHPKHFGLANQLARRFNARQMEQRITYFRIALALRPDNAVCWNNLGSALLLTRDQVGAEAAFRESLRLDPNNSRPHTGLGNVLFEQKKYDAAFAEFREAIRLDPTYAVALNNIGNVLRDKGDFDGAIDSYKKANRIDPKFVLPLVTLGQLLISRGKDDGAIAAFHEAIEKDPPYASAHYALGNVLLKRRDLDGAITEYEATVMLEPSSAPACNSLASALCERGQPLAARQVLRDGVKRNPDWLNTPQTWVRYNIACCAALAAAGKGMRDTVKADPPALRKEALGSLTAELSAWRITLNAGPEKNRGLVHQRMQHWLDDADLGEIRDVEKLPGPERDRWRILWEDVRQLRDETAVSSQPKKVSADGRATAAKQEGPKSEPHAVGPEGLKFTGELSDEDKRVDVNVNFQRARLPAKMYLVQLKAGSKYRLEMVSETLDSFLIVQDKEGKQLAFDDDSGGVNKLDARLDFTPPQTGTYKIFAASNARKTKPGKYTLTVRRLGAGGGKVHERGKGGWNSRSTGSTRAARAVLTVCRLGGGRRRDERELAGPVRPQSLGVPAGLVEQGHPPRVALGNRMVAAPEPQRLYDERGGGLPQSAPSWRAGGPSLTSVTHHGQG
jgi:tetratricopeptide (TPR) repeat protein